MASSAKKMDSSWQEVEDLLLNAAHVGQESKFSNKAVFPGAVAIVSHKGRPVFFKAIGARSVLPEFAPCSLETVYDVASLTKVLVTTTLMMKLVARRRINLDDRISRLLQSFGTFGKQEITLRHILSHSAGFAPTLPFYEEIMRANQGERAGVLHSRGAAAMVYNQIFRMQPKYQPGTSSVYSDIGFILLGHLIEELEGGKSLEKIAYAEIFKPLNLKNTGFIDLKTIKFNRITPKAEIIAPTNQCALRKRIICGEVQDENAWAMGGVAAHAGIFSNAQDVDCFARAMLDCYHGRSDFLPQDIIKKFWTRDESLEESTWALGWDTPSVSASSAGTHFSDKAIGHLSYTGCSLWIDPLREISVTLLSNRVHPSIENKKIKEFRPVFHDAVMKALGY